AARASWLAGSSAPSPARPPPGSSAPSSHPPGAPSVCVLCHSLLLSPSLCAAATATPPMGTFLSSPNGDIFKESRHPEEFPLRGPAFSSILLAWVNAVRRGN